MRNLQRELSPRQGLLAREFHKEFISERLPLMLERLRAAQADPNGKGERPGAGRANQQNRKDQRPANTLRGNNNPQTPARKNLAR